MTSTNVLECLADKKIRQTFFLIMSHKFLLALALVGTLLATSMVMTDAAGVCYVFAH
jgi:hypothetical protein